jgi:predicted lipoprotein with Yx(FWY)xxD motif
MKALRSSRLIGITLLLTVLLVACGETAMQGTPTNTANQNMSNQNGMNNKTDSAMMNATPKATSTMNTSNNGNMNNNNMNNNNMIGGITIVPGMGGNMGAFIHTGVATINGTKVNVLMTNKGFAVYYYRADSMLKATCTDQCAHDWPPILAPQGMMAVSSSMTLPRQLTVHQTANGAQVFYDGHALYTYAADMQPGTATGRAQDMLWYLVGFTL